MLHDTTLFLHCETIFQLVHTKERVQLHHLNLEIQWLVDFGIASLHFNKQKDGDTLSFNTCYIQNKSASR